MVYILPRKASNNINIKAPKKYRAPKYRVYGIDWTNLSPISVDFIFLAPNVANLVFLRIEQKIAF